MKIHPARKAAGLLVLALLISLSVPAAAFPAAALHEQPPLLDPEIPFEPPLVPPGQPSPDETGSPALSTSAEGCTRQFCVYLAQLSKGPAAVVLDRAATVDFYHQVYLPAGSVSPGWTGSVAACNAGQTSLAFRNAVLSRLNYFRVMAGIPALEGLDDVYNSLDQAAALMMSANGQLSHDPPTSWRCYTQAGAEGAGSSNLFLGRYGPAAITGYIQDPGASNTALGHRRWILYPQNRRMGTGDIPGSSGVTAANALRAWDSNYGSARPATRDPFVAWPPAGYVPYQVVFARWSFAYPGANFDSATVSMTRSGASVPVTRYTPAYGYGEPTLGWLVNNLSDSAAWPRPGADDSYVVTVRNVIINGQPRDFIYTVTIIDPG